MSSDWRKGIDPKTGLTYYFNRKTKTSQWTKPPEIDDSGVATSPILDPINNPAKWKEAIDPASGLPYWYNKAAGKKSTFIKPACLVNNNSTSAALSPVPAHSHSSTLNNNSHSHSPSSPLPPPVTSSPALSPTPHPAPSTLTEEMVKNAWKTTRDPTTGSIYWVNRLTSQTTWDDPLIPVAVTSSPLPKPTLAQVLKREIGRSPPQSTTIPLSVQHNEKEDTPPPPPEEDEETSQQQQQHTEISQLRSELAAKAALLEKQEQEFALKQAEWEIERAALLRRQDELQLEVVALTEKKRNEPLTLEDLQAGMMEKFSLLESQNQQMLALLQQQPGTNIITNGGQGNSKPLTSSRNPFRSH